MRPRGPRASGLLSRRAGEDSSAAGTQGALSHAVRRPGGDRLRYTKAALLIFGLGLVTGLVVVVGEFSEWDYLASGIMALGLVLLPLGLFADGRGIAALRWIARLFFPTEAASPAARAGPARASASPRRGPRRPRAARRGPKTRSFSAA